MIESKFYVSQDQAKVMQLELDRIGYRRPGGQPEPEIDMVMVVAALAAVYIAGVIVIIAMGVAIGAF